VNPDIALAIAILGPGGYQMVAHYAYKMHAPWTYVHGVALIIVGTIIRAQLVAHPSWCIGIDQLALIAAGQGLLVFVCYGVDYIRGIRGELKRTKREAGNANG